MDQRIGNNLFNDLVKCINYYRDEFDANEYEIVGALYWVLAEVTKGEEDPDDCDDE